MSPRWFFVAHLDEIGIFAFKHCDAGAFAEAEGKTVQGVEEQHKKKTLYTF